MPAKKYVSLTVEFSPQIKTPKPKVAQALNYDTELDCLVEASPPPTVIWKKNGEQIFTNSDYVVAKYASVNELTTSTLQIISLEKSQLGDYYCEASNKLGTVEARLNIYGKLLNILYIIFKAFVI